VIKQGTFNLVFHPHGWIKAEQIVELIDHAVTKHGKKVKFLTFKECAERLNKNLLGGQRLRDARARLNEVHLLNSSAAGFMDAFVGNSTLKSSFVWNSTSRAIVSHDLPKETEPAHLNSTI